jgi:hypothetical protein
MFAGEAWTCRSSEGAFWMQEGLQRRFPATGAIIAASGFFRPFPLTGKGAVNTIHAPAN